MVLRQIRFGFAWRHRHYLSIYLSAEAHLKISNCSLLRSCFPCTIPFLLFTFLNRLLNCAGFIIGKPMKNDEWEIEMKCTNLSVGLMCSRPVQPERDEARRNSFEPLQDLQIPKILKCPPRACAGGNQCLQNRSGPVCGTCLPGHFMSGSGCRLKDSCPTDDIMSLWRWGAIAVFVPIVLFVYVHFVWRPVVPELDWLAGVVLNRISTCMSALISPLLCFRAQDRGTANESGNGVVTFISRGLLLASAMVNDLKSRSQEFHVPQYLKILVSFFLSHCNFTESKLHEFGLQSWRRKFSD
jgi:hypothetical protein